MSQASIFSPLIVCLSHASSETVPQLKWTTSHYLKLQLTHCLSYRINSKWLCIVYITFHIWSPTFFFSMISLHFPNYLPHPLYCVTVLCQRCSLCLGYHRSASFLAWRMYTILFKIILGVTSSVKSHLSLPHRKRNSNSYDLISQPHILGLLWGYF